MSIPAEDIWHDEGLNLDFHFNEQGFFVDNEGKRILDHPKGFQNNDLFGDWLHAYVERQMTKEGLLSRLIPEDNGSPIWYTPGAFNQADKLLVIICGSGRIPAGLLSVGVCAYHGLDMGSDLPWIRWAKSRNMEVVILNPNHIGYRQLKKKYNTYGSSEHCLAVFEDLIIPSSPNNVYVLAHSMGGECVCDICNNFQEWYIQHVKATALTDAVEDVIKNKTGFTHDYLKTRMIDWVGSSEEGNTKLPPSKLCAHRSAGTKDHPLTTGKAKDYIIEWFEKLGA